MNHSSENNLKLLCTDTNKLKDTYYGSIHRANFSINGEKGDWDILRISIPFAPLKEAEFMQRFHVSREELPGFYASFEKAVLSALRSSGSRAPIFPTSTASRSVCFRQRRSSARTASHLGLWTWTPVIWRALRERNT